MSKHCHFIICSDELWSISGIFSAEFWFVAVILLLWHNYAWIVVLFYLDLLKVFDSNMDWNNIYMRTIHIDASTWWLYIAKQYWTKTDGVVVMVLERTIDMTRIMIEYSIISIAIATVRGCNVDQVKSIHIQLVIHRLFSLKDLSFKVNPVILG